MNVAMLTKNQTLRNLPQELTHNSWEGYEFLELQKVSLYAKVITSKLI